MKIKDNRENEPMSFCQGCDAGHQDGKGYIIDTDRECWLERRHVIRNKRKKRTKM